MLIMGVSHLMKSDYFLSQKTKELLGEEKFRSYQKGLVFPQFFTGALMICMSIVEDRMILQTSIFVSLYIVLGIIPVILLIRNNKKKHWSILVLGKRRLLSKVEK